MTDFKALLEALADNDLEKLIETKRAAGRPKDLEAIAELEALRETLAEE